MREIKFRAWDESDQCMFYQNDIGEDFDFEIYPNELKLLVNEQYHECGSGVPVELWKYVERKALFMQYTGLKDKTGVEIYEGDILSKYIAGDGRFEQVECEKLDSEDSVVRFLGGAFVVYCGCVGDFENDLTVIGNIYENPELLEANNES